MTNLYDPVTGVKVDIPEEEKEDAVLSGKFGLDPKVEPILVDPSDGARFSVPQDKLREALEAGWTFESNLQAAKREYGVEVEKEGILGAVKTGAKNFVDELFLGLPEFAVETAARGERLDPKTGKLNYVGRQEVEKAINPGSNLAGGLAGTALSFLYGGGELKGLYKGSELAAKGVTKLAETFGEKAANSILTKAAAKAAQGATTGVIAAAPFAITDELLGDGEAAAEILIAGATLGGGIGLGAAALKNPVSAAINGARNLNPEKAAEWVDALKTRASLAATGGKSSEFKKFVDIERQVTGSSKLPYNKALGQADEFIHKDLGLSKKGMMQNNPGKLVELRNDAEKLVSDQRAKIAAQIDKANPDGVLSFDAVNAQLNSLKDRYATNAGKVSGDLADIDTALNLTIGAYAEKMNKMGVKVSKDAAAEVFPKMVDAATFDQIVKNGDIKIPNLSLVETEALKKRIGDLRYAQSGKVGGSATEASGELYKSMLDLSETVGNAVSDKALGSQFRETGKKLQRLYLYRKPLEEMAARNDTNRILSPWDITAGAAAGLPAAGGSFLMRQYGGRAREAALFGAAKVIDKFGEKVSSTIDRSLGLAEKTYNRVAPAASISVMGKIFDDDDSNEDKIKKLNKIGDSLSRLTTDPQMATQVGAAYTNDLNDLGGNIPPLYQMKLSNTFQYLMDALPKPEYAVDPLNPRPFVPSDRQMAAFERKLNTVIDPMSVLEDIESASITKEQVDAIRTVYPQMYKAISSQFAQKMTQVTKPIPYAVRQKIKLFLGDEAVINHDSRQLLNLQGNFASLDKAKPKANSKITEASRSSTDVSRILSNE